jgi:transglutaminase-like putative cysteine protease
MGSTNSRTFPVNSYRGVARSKTRQILGSIPSGLPGIRQTLQHMRAFVDQYKTAPQVRELALSLTRNLPQKAYSQEAEVISEFVKNRIRYVRDINGVETVQTPVKTLEYGAGDCDDKSTLLAAMLESLGFETRFHAMGFRLGDISHVLLECRIGDKWIALETTEPVAMGWLPKNIRESMYG